MMKIAVLTSTSGSNNPPNPIPFDGVDYHVFTDKKIDNDMWNQHDIISMSEDPIYKNRRDAKIYKILPHVFVPDYDYYVWVDATHKLLVHPEEIIKKFLVDADMALFKHQERDCVYDEADEIRKLRLDHDDLVQHQMEYYKSRGYPDHNGLFELTARVQKNNEVTRKLGWMWWEQICKYSSRDQLSFPYVFKQLKIRYRIIPGHNQPWGNNGYFYRNEMGRHKRQR